MTEEDDEIDEHEHAARAEREPLDGECLVLCGFAPSLLMLRGGQPLDIERLRRPVDAARLALRAHIEARELLYSACARPAVPQRRVGRFLYKAPLGTPPSVTIGPVAPQLSSRRPRDVACAAEKWRPRSLHPRSLRRLRSTRRRRRRQRSRPAPSGRRSPKTLRSAATSRCVAAQLPAKAPEASAVFSTRLASLALAPSSALSSCSWPRRHRPLNPILSLTLVPPPFYFYSLAADC